MANTAAFLHLTSSSGAKHFKGATTEALNSQPFNFSDDSDLQVFLDLVLTKSQEIWGWNSIFTVPVMDVTAARITRNCNLLTHHGLIPVSSVRLHVLSAQDSFMACQCLLNSLALDLLKIITADLDSCHLPAAGPLLLKMIILSQAHVDSLATVSFIRIC